jgi:ribosome biogenesis GTPase A
MTQGFFKHINQLIKESDLILELLDARFVQETRNRELEERILNSGKGLLFVINKADLVEKENLEKEKEKLLNEKKGRVIFISAKEKNGISMIRKEISIAKKKEEIVIGIIGYPNLGKSTLINALSSKGKVKTSKKAGLTRGIQKIRLGKGIMLIDSPGIIPKDAEEGDLFLVNSKNPNQLDDVEGVALKLIGKFKERITKKFDVKGEDEVDLLEAIGKEKKFFKKGGIADTERTARFLLEEYQKGKI